MSTQDWVDTKLTIKRIAKSRTLELKKTKNREEVFLLKQIEAQWFAPSFDLPPLDELLKTWSKNQETSKMAQLKHWRKKWKHLRNISSKSLFAKVRAMKESAKMPRLVHKGIVADNPKDIVESVADFYSDLFTKRPIQQQLFEIQKSTKTSEEDISLLEMTEHIHKARNEKTPGPDGLSIEVYKRFPKLITLLLQT